MILLCSALPPPPPALHYTTLLHTSPLLLCLLQVRDLLDNHRIKTNLTVREDKVKGIYIAGVTEEYVTSQEELLDIMSAGALNRATAATGMNEGSSRSHSVFSITG